MSHSRSAAGAAAGIVGWALFDFANSSYTTVIVTVAFSVYFTKLVAAGPGADRLWGLGITASNLIVVLLSPVLGAAADETGRKKLFLFATYALCVAGTAGLWYVRPGALALGLLLYVVSNVAFSLGENSSAPLPRSPVNVGRISGFGWGLGYRRPRLAAGSGHSGRLQSGARGLRLVWPVTAGY